MPRAIKRCSHLTATGPIHGSIQPATDPTPKRSPSLSPWYRAIGRLGAVSIPSLPSARLGNSLVCENPSRRPRCRLERCPTEASRASYRASMLRKSRLRRTGRSDGRIVVFLSLRPTLLVIRMFRLLGFSRSLSFSPAFFFSQRRKYKVRAGTCVSDNEPTADQMDPSPPSPPRKTHQQVFSRTGRPCRRRCRRFPHFRRCLRRHPFK